MVAYWRHLRNMALAKDISPQILLLLLFTTPCLSPGSPPRPYVFIHGHL